MNSTSPAHSSVSTTAIISGGGGGGSSSNTALDDFHFPSDLISIQDRKDEAMRALKSDLMAALNKEVKSLDEDNWMFEGPRSRIHLISRPALITSHHHLLEFSKTWLKVLVDFFISGDVLVTGGFQHKQMEITKNRNFLLK